MIFVTDSSGKATYVGPEWKEMTGQGLAEAVNFGWVAVVHPDDRDIVRRLVLVAIANQSEFSVRYRLLLQSGVCIWVAAGAVPSYGPPGRTFLGFLGSITRIADATAEGLTAYGSLGPFRPPSTLPSPQPVSLLEMAADHLIMAHAFLSSDGGRGALPALESALHHVGVALARASAQDAKGAGPVH